MPHSREAVVAAIRASWSKETTASPDEWTEDAPALGQCVPSSLVAQELLGGELERLATVRNGARETHYRNVLPTARYLIFLATSTPAISSSNRHLWRVTYASMYWAMKIPVGAMHCFVSWRYER